MLLIILSKDCYSLGGITDDAVWLGICSGSFFDIGGPMKLVKKINNNFAVAVDDNGEEVVVYGKGIGFQKMPCVLSDLSLISRSYYNVDPKYLSMIGSISPKTLEIAIVLVDECRMKLRVKLNPNLLFTMADHLDFAIRRTQRKLTFSYPMVYDLQQMYEKEMEIAEHARQLVKQHIQVQLPKSETAGILLNIVNAEMINSDSKTSINEEEIITNITGIIQNFFRIKIDRTTVNYARYASHMHYLLDRLSRKQRLSSENIALLSKAVDEFPKEHACAMKIASYLEMKYESEISEEELLYLMLHINRLCVREGL